jgi:formylglycine-generating enzyme required for sulfatase activity
LLATTEVTIGQFRQFVTETKYVTEAEVFGNANAAGPSPASTAEKNGFDWRNPGYAQIEEDAVSQVTWNDAAVFCNWLSTREKLQPSYERHEKDMWQLLPGANGYRLPTEAQWEYACRAGTTTQYSFGDDPRELGKYGWFLLKSGSNPVRRVGSKPANPFGLYDMHGNLFEWCEDLYAARRYANPDVENPSAVLNDPPRVLRGGDWFGNALRCRSAFRGYGAQSTRSDDVGVRLLRPL